jgi:hypothetical protein
VYIVRNKRTKELIHVNPAPLSQPLEGEDVYVRFDPKTMEIGRTDGPLPERFDIGPDGKIVPLEEQTPPGAGSPETAAGQKVVEDEAGPRLVDKSSAELVEEGLLTPEALLDRKLTSLRGEVTELFRRHTTPNGYRVDALARQKASFSYPFRQLPDSDDRKRELLEAGLIYPDAVLDEILAGVTEVQNAYRAAKQAVTTAFEAGEPVEAWESIALRDHLPGDRPVRATRATKPAKAAKAAKPRAAATRPRKKKTSKTTGKKTGGKTTRKKRGS